MQVVSLFPRDSTQDAQLALHKRHTLKASCSTVASGSRESVSNLAPGMLSENRRLSLSIGVCSCALAGVLLKICFCCLSYKAINVINTFSPHLPHAWLHLAGFSEVSPFTLFDLTFFGGQGCQHPLVRLILNGNLPQK